MASGVPGGEVGQPGQVAGGKDKSVCRVQFELLASAFVFAFAFREFVDVNEVLMYRDD